MQARSDHWQPITSASQDGTAVLLFHALLDLLQVGLLDEATRAWQAPNGDLLSRTPTHWMPRPPLPGAEPSAA
jgi:hypothetical protein